MLSQDCFFVSVVIRNHPELLDQPVAVSHSNNSNGTAEISSANYPARSHGWLCAKLYIIAWLSKLCYNFFVCNLFF